MSDTSKAVFLSYASQDAETAKLICAALRAAGVKVWFDQNELRGGEAWDRKIKTQIRECTLFLPIISANTQARPEGYFRLEWHLAEQRSLLIARGRPFIVPVSLDTTTEREALVPDAFLAVQWTRLPNATVPPELIAQVARLLTVSATPVGSGATGNSGVAIAREGPAVIPDFELLREIGQGAYGEVWLARGLTGVYRAIKVVWRDRFNRAEPFEREFHGLKKFSAMSLPGANQLALLHVGQNTGAGYFYYVMELADDVATGREVDPAQYVPLTLREVRTRRGRLPATECVVFGVGLARALAGLHERGLVHRDIKPSNIILVGGVPKLADIGLVAETADALSYVGTEGFVPPEGPGKPAADVFALGKLLYELATGLDRAEYPRLPSDLGQGADRKLFFQLNEVIVRACDPDPAKRYPDAPALLDDLTKLESTPAMSGMRRAPRAAEHSWAKTVLSLGGMAIGLIFALRFTLNRTARREAPPSSSVTAAPAPPAPPALPAPENPSESRVSPDSLPQTQAPKSTVSNPLPANAKSVAVLAFANLSDDKANEYFSDGISEELLTVLQKIPGLHVAARTSAFSFKGKNVTVQEIGRTLGVAAVVDGSVRRSGNQVRIAARLNRTDTGEQVWSENYTRDAKDVFAVQTELAETILAQLRGQLGEAQSQAEIVSQVEAAEKGGTRNPAAHELFLQGRYFVNRATVEDVAHAADLLQQAVELDPNYALAWAALSGAGWFRGAFSPKLEDIQAGFNLARRAADRAIALEPGLAAGYLARMDIEGTIDFDWKAGEASLRRAQALAPDDPAVIYRAAQVAYCLNQKEKAVALIQRSAGLDPVNPLVWVNQGWFLLGTGQIDRAQQSFRRGIALSPHTPWAHGGLSAALLLAGRPDEAEREAELETTGYARLTTLAVTRWDQKKTAESDAALAQLTRETENVAAYQIACIHAYRGEADEAFLWLERAYRQHDPGFSWTKADLWFDKIHSDPRWPVLLRKVGLADDQLQ